MYEGHWAVDANMWELGAGRRVLDVNGWVLNPGAGPWMVRAGCWMVVAGHWMLDWLDSWCRMLDARLLNVGRTMAACWQLDVGC